MVKIIILISVLAVISFCAARAGRPEPADFALRQKQRAFALATRLHVVALCVSAFAIVAGVLGALGGLP
jgi:hypothetical protein